MAFLEGGGGQGSFFLRRFPLDRNIRKKFSPAPLFKKLKKEIEKVAITLLLIRKFNTTFVGTGVLDCP